MLSSSDLVPWADPGHREICPFCPWACPDETPNYYKLASHQRYAFAQYNYGICLQNVEGVSLDLKGAAHSSKLAADQGIAVAQFNYENCLQNSKGVSKYFQLAAHSFKISNLNLLLIKEMLLLNSIMGIAWRKVKVFRNIWKEPHIILNLLLIKEMLLLNSIMRIAWRKLKVFQKIWKEPHIIFNLLLIKEYC